MKVSELIELLAHFPMDMEVLTVQNMMGDYQPLDKEMIMVTTEGLHL